MGYHDDKVVMLKKFKPLYEGLKNGDVEEVVELFENLFPTTNLWQSTGLPTVLDDTPLQIAVSMGREDIARALLTRCIQNNLRSLIAHRNCFQDTILHEVAKTDMVSLASNLLFKAPELLSVPNRLGEMPLFCVAHNGSRKMFDLLAQAVHTQDNANLHKHLTRDDNTNILHLSILSEYFGAYI
ncbi:hypothetical protein FNV43_RR06581 [Rhamnella rubrinervis]|uniref:Uncharacterized protein n=1 Tax=Rhamnella rubrinervis TaxID=2594499 RepID=A0A8K0HD81_9ROSA|nr:hypothetical protein FNV43_RR06581 [Rhamnella rubrinervis]